jgi:hypothetical protein
MSISREQIIDQIGRQLQDNPMVYAFWLEGADGTATVDAYSDLDIWLDVEDGAEGAVFEEVEAGLSWLGRIDYRYEKPMDHPQLRHRLYHLEGTPASLLLDVVIQSHSREFEFVRQQDSERPKVIWDKAQVVRFRDVDEAELARTIRERLYHLKHSFLPEARVRKYMERDEFLECLAYYHRYVLEPLVEALRLRYVPLDHDFGLVHISRHLPAAVVAELEELYKVTSVEDVADRMGWAAEMFAGTVRHLEAMYGGVPGAQEVRVED